MRSLSRSSLECVYKAGMYFVGCLRFDDILPVAAIPLRVPDRAVLFLDAFQNVRRNWAPAAIWKNRVGQRQFGERDFAAAKKCRWIWAKRGADSRGTAKLRDFIESRVHADTDSCAVLRFGKSLAGRRRTLVADVYAFPTPFAKNYGRATDHDLSIIELRCFHHGSRIHSILECGRVNKWFHRCAGGTLGLQRAIVLIVFEIAAAHQHQDGAGFVIEPNDGALQILRRRLTRRRAARFRLAKIRRVLGVGLMIVTGMLLGLIETLAQRFFRHFLQIGINRCVNTEAFVHGPIPSDGCDYLLTDVIDRVGLSPRIWPSADENILGFRRRRFGPVNQTKVSHAIEYVVARFARRGFVRPGR